MARSIDKWDSLSPAYRSRVDRLMGRDAWLRGDSVSPARGHRATPERPERAMRNPERYETYLRKDREQALAQRSIWQRQAERLGIDRVAPWFSLVPQQDKERVAEDYVKGFMQPGTASDSDKHSREDIIQYAARKRRGGDKRYSTDREFWRRYREDYARTFGGK